MKRMNFVLMALGIASLISCQKDIESPVQVVENSGITTFTATMPETKTTLGVSGGKHFMNWASGDKIRVMGYTEGADVEEAIYVLKSGDGTKNATFEIEEGQTMGNHTHYYAFYPSSIKIKTASLPSKLEINSGLTVDSQAIVENGYDSSLAIMTATSDSDGNLAFKHGAAYLGIQIPEDNITKVQITFGKNAAQKRPAYSTENGSITDNNSGTGTIATAAGTFVKGSYYYLCAIPNTANKMTSVKVTYTYKGQEKSVTSTTMGDDKLAVGTVYDFGCPPILFAPPSISAENVEVPATTTNGSISYTVLDEVDGGQLTVTILEGATIANLAIGTPASGSLGFTCDANTESTPKTATIRFTYTYNTSETVTKDVVLTQLGQGSSASHTYLLYLDSNGSIVQKKDSETGSYFTVTGKSSPLQCSASSYFGVDSYTIAGDSYTYAKKIDSSNNISFTATSGYTSKVRFYCASRNTNTTATMKFNEGSSTVKTLSLTWTDNKADLIDSGEISLTAGSTYTFAKSGEVGVFYIVVTETPSL